MSRPAALDRRPVRIGGFALEAVVERVDSYFLSSWSKIAAAAPSAFSGFLLAILLARKILVDVVEGSLAPAPNGTEAAPATREQRGMPRDHMSIMIDRAMAAVSEDGLTGARRIGLSEV